MRHSQFDQVMKYFLIITLLSFSYGQLITPNDNAHLNHVHILFEWEQVPEASGYELQISQDPEFSNDLIQVSNNSLVYIERELIDWESTYFWRVRPVHGQDPGPWSGAYSFTTGQTLSSSSVNVIDESEYSPGVTVFGAFFNYFSAVIDGNGREIWNSGDDDFVYYSAHHNGNILGCHLLSGAENNLPGSEVAFDGETIWSEPNDDFLHHDIIRLPNGNYLGIVETSSLGVIPVGGWTSLFQGLGFQADGVTVEFPWIGDRLVEWDKDTKEVVWSWNVFDHFDMSDHDQLGGTWTEAYISLHYDWTHVNAVIFDEEESCLYVSARHLSRITKIDYPSGDIIWNLGHDMPSGDVSLGTELGFSFQHSLQKLENGNLMTFDNGNLAPEFRGTEDPASRAIEIAINGTEASIVWSYDLSPDLFGFASGNTQKLENGNVLLTTVGGGGRSLEVDTVGEIIWEGLYNLSLPDGAVYRANRIPGIFPLAYSVIVEDLNEYNGDVGVYLPTGSSTISYDIVNDGLYPITLSCHINDDEGWFGSQTIQLSIEPGMNETISFQGSVSSIEQGNPIHLTVIPDHHANRSKMISTNGFTSPLSSIDNLQPVSFHLDRPYPNPFNPSTKIEFHLKNNQDVLLEIYGINGQRVETLIERRTFAGKHIINWNANNIAAGIYFIKMRVSDRVKTQKVILLK